LVISKNKKITTKRRRQKRVSSQRFHSTYIPGCW